MVRLLKMMAVSLLIPLSCQAVELYDHFPAAIHTDERYVIYSHGLIVEGNDPKPISPKFGPTSTKIPAEHSTGWSLSSLSPVVRTLEAATRTASARIVVAT